MAEQQTIVVNNRDNQPLTDAIAKALSEPNTLVGLGQAGTVGELIAYLQQYPANTPVYGQLEEPLVLTAFAITHAGAPRDLLGERYIVIENRP